VPQWRLRRLRLHGAERSVDLGAYQPATLTAEMRAAGKALMCCATPLEDAEIEVDVDSLDPDGRPAVRLYQGKSRVHGAAPRLGHAPAIVVAGRRANRVRRGPVSEHRFSTTDSAGHTRSPTRRNENE